MRYAVGCPAPFISVCNLSMVLDDLALNAKNPTLSNRVSLIRSLAMSYFHMANATLSSALFRFTTEFGMGSGGSKTLLSPSKMRGKDSRQSASRLRVLCAR